MFFTRHNNSERNVRGSRRGEEIYPEDAVSDAMHHSTGRGQRAGGERQVETPLGPVRFFALYAVIGAVLAVFLGVAVWLQIFRHDAFAKLAERNITREQVIRPLRGVIYDSEGNKLVQNVARYSLVVDKRDFPSDQDSQRQSIGRAAEAVDLTIEDALKKVRETNSPRVTLARNLSHDTYIAAREVVKDMPGTSAGWMTRRLPNLTNTHRTGTSGKPA